MKVLILKTGKTAEVNDSYGARMIEQGRAVVIPSKAVMKPKKTEEPTEEAPPVEKPKATRRKQGNGPERPHSD